MNDYYKILGIKFGADIFEIKFAYRRLALKYHPDQNPSEDAQEKFIEFTEAYEVLKDPLKRKEYDSHYKQYFGNETSFIDQVNYEKYEQKAKYWAKYGRRKAEEYSNLKYNKFAKRAFREVKLGISIIPNIIAIFFVSGVLMQMVFYLPIGFSTKLGSLLSLIFISLIGYLDFHLCKVLYLDYSEARRRTIS